MSSINPKIFKAYDIRGLYPEELNEENIVDIIRAVYTYMSRTLKKRDITIVSSQDMRISSPSLHEKIVKTLEQCGAKVVNIGLASTPTMYFATRHYEYDAGIQLSASHNPKDYNGLKMVIRDGNKLKKIGTINGMDEVKRIALEQDFAEYVEGGAIVERDDILSEEITQALKTVDIADVNNLKIVADPANAMGIPLLHEVFNRFDAELIPMNFDLDGTFPAHQADPLQFKTLEGLQQKVRDEKANLGIAMDGDGDRVFFLDEQGNILQASYITALIAREILKKTPGEKIIFDVRYTRNAKKVIQDNGGTPLMCKVGHAFITEQLNREGAAFAGESSGHYFFRDTGGGESSVRVILYVLSVLAREKKPMSEIIAELVSSYESGENNFHLKDGFDVKTFLATLAEEYKDGEVSTLDGIAVDYPDWRFNIRASNTEPLIRLCAEGKNKEIVDQKVQELKTKIEKANG